MPRGAGHVVFLDAAAFVRSSSISSTTSSVASSSCNASYAATATSSQDVGGVVPSATAAMRQRRRRPWQQQQRYHYRCVQRGPLRHLQSLAAVEQRFSLASVAFADKLAEQGYKDAERRVAHASAFLRRQHGIQRVALIGFGAAADAALRLAVQPSGAAPIADCVVALSPDGRALWPEGESATSHALPPTLVLVPGKSHYASSDEFRRLQRVFRASPTFSTDPPSFRARVFPDRSKGFAFSGITDEDAATQAIAEILDWLVVHLHRFRIAACTSDTDPWWPQGRNGPFLNVGLQAWQASRTAWITPTHEHPGRPPRVPSHLVFDGLSSVRRTFELPQRMALGDVVEIFVDIWEVQQ
ncbi:hypothetical protein PINS_up001863 [Pythium insidiosum]|nr:hypothetical protein PINS_up001863 [Pythium insidiosum]